MMNKTVLILTSVALTLPAIASAEASPKEERVGVGSGLLVGAAAGGPIGMIFGAAIGGLLGSKMNEHKTGRQEAEERYAAAIRDLDAIEDLLHGSERDVARLRRDLNSQRSKYRDALQETLAAEIYFHTGESAIDRRTEERIARISSAIRLVDDYAIVVEGYADARGDAQYNEQLSAERAHSVREVLVAAGIPSDRVTTTAVGETRSTAAENDLDSLALERRVQINLVYPGGNSRVAAQ